MHLFKKQFFSSFQCLGLQFLWMKDGVMSVMFGRLSTTWFLHMCVFLPHSKHTFPTANLYTDLVIQKTNWWISLLRFIRFDTFNSWLSHLHTSHINIYVYLYTFEAEPVVFGILVHMYVSTIWYLISGLAMMNQHLRLCNVGESPHPWTANSTNSHHWGGAAR